MKVKNRSNKIIKINGEEWKPGEFMSMPMEQAEYYNEQVFRGEREHRHGSAKNCRRRQKPGVCLPVTAYEAADSQADEVEQTTPVSKKPKKAKGK